MFQNLPKNMPNGKWFAKISGDKSVIINMIYPKILQITRILA